MSGLTSDGFCHSSSSGALAGAAAGGVCWAFLWQSAAKLAVIEFFRIHAVVVTSFTAAQEWGFDAIIGRTYSVAHTGGTQFTPGGSAGGFAKMAGQAASLAAEIRMATTVALGGGTVTPDAQPFTSDINWELVAAATVAKSRVDTGGVLMDQEQSSPFILQQNEGILVRPTQTLGAGGVVRLSVDISWREIDPSLLMRTMERRYQ